MNYSFFVNFLKALTYSFFVYYFYYLMGNTILDNIEQPVRYSPYVKIMEGIPGGSLNQTCSGSIVSPDFAISAAHCFEDEDTTFFTGKKYYIKDESGVKIVAVDIYKLDYRKDLVVLKGDFRSFNSLKVVDSGVSQTSKLEACGYPRGSKKLVCHPFIYRGQSVVNGDFKVIGDSQIYTGMSGGPLVDRKKGIIYATGFGIISHTGRYWIVTVNPLVSSQIEYLYISKPADIKTRNWTAFPFFDIIQIRGK